MLGNNISCGKIMNKYIFIFLVLTSTSYANEANKAFNKLKFITIDYSQVGDINVFYNEKLTKILNKEIIINKDNYNSTKVIETKIDYKSKEKHIIEYSEGFSVDPHFTIYKKNKNKLIELTSFSGTEIFIPGNGNIYISGHTNNMFNMKLKYKLVDSSFIEVKQPYYYVGVKSKIKENITLYASQKMKNEVAKLPKDSVVTVLLNDGKDYLLKSPFGLTGWYRIKHEYPVGLHHKSELEGIYNNGD